MINGNRRNTYPSLENNNKMSACLHCFSIIEDMDNICERITKIENKIKEFTCFYELINKLENKIKELELRLDNTDSIMSSLPEDPIINDFHFKMSAINSYDDME